MSMITRIIFVFLRIGLFGFGGGFAILPFIQSELLARGWMGLNEFNNIVSIAQITPGPLGINTATYVGYKLAGFWGSLAGTLALVFIPFLLTLIVGHFYNKYKQNETVKRVLAGIRPVTLALIFIAGINLLYQTIFNSTLSIYSIDYIGLVMFAAALFVSIRFKVSPMYIMLAGGVIGLIVF